MSGITTPYKESVESGSNDPQAWHCFSCRRIHLRTGQHLLTFTSEEFTALTQSIIACYCSQIVSGANEQLPDDEASILQLNEALN